MAQQSSISLIHLLILFLAFSIVTAGQKNGNGGGRKSGKGHTSGGNKNGKNDKKDGNIVMATGPAIPAAGNGNDIETNFRGSWAIDNPNVGVAAMQFQLMPNNKAVWFDTTSLGPSARELGPPGNCPKAPEMNFKPDCFAHAIAYDVETGQSRTIYVGELFLQT